MFFFSIKVDGAFDPGDGFSPVKCRFAYHFIINWLLYYYDVIRARRLTPWCKTPSMDFNWWIILTYNLTAFSFLIWHSLFIDRLRLKELLHRFRTASQSN